MKKVLYITILACSTLWVYCTEKNKQSVRTDSFIEKNVAFARAQIGNEIRIIEKSEKFTNPVTLKTDSTIIIVTTPTGEVVFSLGQCGIYMN